MATNAVYKVYSGDASTGWIEYHFRTNAAQVTQTTGTGWRKFMSAKVKINGQAFTEVTTGDDAGGATVTLTGAHINNGVASNGNYITAGAKINATLSALDTQLKAAMDLIPNAVTESTVSGWGFTKNTGTVTGIKVGSSGSTLSPSSGVVTIPAYPTTLPASDVSAWAKASTKPSYSALEISCTGMVGSPLNGANVQTALENVAALAYGRSRAIGINLTTSTTASGYTMVNSSFNTNDPQITISASQGAISQGVGYNTNKALAYGSGNDYIDIGQLKVGDNVFVTSTGVPDRWVSSITSAGNVVTVTFDKLETQVVDLSWSNISGKPTLSISNGTITIGSNSIKPLTAHPTISVSSDTTDTGTLSHSGTFTAITSVTRDGNGHVTKINTKTYTLPSDNDTKNTAGSTNDSGVKKYLIAAKEQSANPQTYSQSGCYIGTDNFLYSGSKKVSTQVTTVGTTAPSSPSGGDIWIDTTA